MTHPILPAGYNADDNNGDEVDGAGTNWPVWPWMFDTFEAFTPLIISDEMMAAFIACPDIVFPCEPNTIVFPRESRTVPVRKAG